MWLHNEGYIPFAYSQRSQFCTPWASGYVYTTSATVVRLQRCNDTAVT